MERLDKYKEVSKQLAEILHIESSELMYDYLIKNGDEAVDMVQEILDYKDKYNVEHLTQEQLFIFTRKYNLPDLPGVISNTCLTHNIPSKITPSEVKKDEKSFILTCTMISGYFFIISVLIVLTRTLNKDLYNLPLLALVTFVYMLLSGLLIKNSIDKHINKEIKNG